MVRVIAEAGMCLNSIDWALAAAEEAQKAGCWGFKVQLLNPDTLAVPASPRYDRLAGPDSQYEAFTGALPYAAWREVKAYCDSVGLEFLASAWDHEAVDELAAMGCSWIKVGSADLTYLPLLRYIAANFNGMVILSVGAGTTAEITRAIEALDPLGVVLLACTLSYPASHPNLRRIPSLRRKFKDPRIVEVGYSDHTQAPITAAYAVLAGATMLEKHFTISPGIGGDHDFALTPREMADYVLFASATVEHLLGDGTQLASPEEAPALNLARRSLHATTDIPANTPLVVGKNCAWLRPALKGIAPDSSSWADGAYLARDPIPQWAPITWPMVLAD